MNKLKIVINLNHISSLIVAFINVIFLQHNIMINIVNMTYIICTHKNTCKVMDIHFFIIFICLVTLSFVFDKMGRKMWFYIRLMGFHFAHHIY